MTLGNSEMECNITAHFAQWVQLQFWYLQLKTGILDAKVFFYAYIYLSTSYTYNFADRMLHRKAVCFIGNRKKEYQKSAEYWVQ